MQETADLFTFTKEILNGKLHFLCSVSCPENKCFENLWETPLNVSISEGVHLTLPHHIFSVQVKSGACYITGQWVASSE